MRKADPKLAERWRGRIQRQQASGCSIAAFCAREGVSVASFHNWKRKLAANPQATHRPAKADFLSVHLAQDAMPSHALEVELPNQVVVRVGAQAPAALARRLLRAAARLPQPSHAQEERR